MFFEKIVLPLFIKRFVAGETLEEIIALVREYNKKGMGVLINYLGEDANSQKIAEENKDAYLDIIKVIKNEHLSARPSLKLTQIGLKLDDSELCYRHLKTIIQEAAKDINEKKILVEIDMEDSTCTQKTMGLILKLHQDDLSGYIRMAFQAYLHRGLNDFRELSKMGISLRLCKGAYTESPKIACRDEEQIRNYLLLYFIGGITRRIKPALATHDIKILDFAKKYGVDKDEFEFQLLFGLRKREREKLIEKGYNCWIYLTYRKKEKGWAYMKRRWRYAIKNFPSLLLDEFLFIFENKLKRLN